MRDSDFESDFHDRDLDSIPDDDFREPAKPVSDEEAREALGRLLLHAEASDTILEYEQIIQPERAIEDSELRGTTGYMLAAYIDETAALRAQLAEARAQRNQAVG